jgi:hypothetical protein
VPRGGGGRGGFGPDRRAAPRPAAAHGRRLRAGGAPDTGTGEPGWLPGGPPAIVPVVGSNGLNRFSNLNGSKMFNFFKLWLTKK